jgi:hypothetical protein
MKLDEAVPVISEEATVGKRTVEVGRTVVAKTVEQEIQPIETVLTHDEVSVERVPINIYVDAVPAVRVEGDTTIFPVLREVAVVVTRLLVVEEVRVTKRFARHVDRQEVPVRVEHVEVTKTH